VRRRRRRRRRRRTMTTASRARKPACGGPWRFARAAHRSALWALGSSGIRVLVATLALLTR
jgi:hypothetical protein